MSACEQNRDETSTPVLAQWDSLLYRSAKFEVGNSRWSPLNFNIGHQHAIVDFPIIFRLNVISTPLLICWTPQSLVQPSTFRSYLSKSRDKSVPLSLLFGSHHLDFPLPVTPDRIPNGLVVYSFPKLFQWCITCYIFHGLGGKFEAGEIRNPSRKKATY